MAPQRDSRMDERAGSRLMLAYLTMNESAPGLDRAEGADSFSTMIPTHEEQTHVVYHDQGACVQSRD